MFPAGREGFGRHRVTALKVFPGAHRKLAQLEGHTAEPPLDGPQQGSRYRIQLTNLGSDPLKAVYRGGKLYVTMNDAADFFARYYAPGNAVLSLAGALDVDATMATISTNNQMRTYATHARSARRRRSASRTASPRRRAARWPAPSARPARWD